MPLVVRSAGSFFGLLLQGCIRRTPWRFGARERLLSRLQQGCGIHRPQWACVSLLRTKRPTKRHRPGPMLFQAAPVARVHASYRWRGGVSQCQCLPKGLAVRCHRGSPSCARAPFLLETAPAAAFPWSGSARPKNNFQNPIRPPKALLPHRHHNIISSTTLDGN